ncbi:tetratricopeptide repeat protein [Micromonospora sp. DH14]|uniref:tetratricopeptide repeat protein n=1 Tax=Micromonospora sp. DH14 TaxID=3040120 RepID=UPI0024414A9E|nr:tetratricopeptide repeat protein [Micromonospora sp. DH14]MDG9672460.1 tetratricopeptide repeat protein [Micromonospora sp. DH14]
MEPQSGNGDDAVARARELVRAEQFGPAIELLREHLNAHPDDGIAWRRLAGALIGLGEHAAAVDAAGRAIDIDPEDVAAYRYRALALLMLKRDGESYADAKRAVELAPDDHEALSLLARNVIEVDRDIARFKELIGRALTVNPDSAPARHLARQYRRLHRRNLAVAMHLVILPAAIVLLFGWFAVDTGRSTDARWMMWPCLVALGAILVRGLFTWSAPGVLPMLTLPQVSAAASAAGIVAAGAGYGATRGVPAAAVLGLTAVAISGAFGLLLLQQRRRIAGGACRSGSL